MLVYLDDFLVIAPSREKCLEHMSIMANMFRSLGLQFKDSKTQGPAQCLEFLGITFETVDMFATVSAPRRAKITAKIATFLATAPREEDPVQRRALASVLGSLQWVAMFYLEGRALLRRGYTQLYAFPEHLDPKAAWHKSVHIALPEAVRVDLRTWQALLQTQPRRMLYLRDPLHNGD